MSRNTRTSGDTANKPATLYEGEQYLDTEVGVLYIGKADNTEIVISSVDPGTAASPYLKWNNTTKKFEKQTIAGILGLKKYVAKITQTGVLAPVATILVNTLGVVPTLAYVDVGQYSITATGKFTVGKVVAKITFDLAVADAVRSAKINHVSANALAIATFDDTGTGADALLTAATLEIEVYD